MSSFYRFAYAIGFRPWERAGREAAGQFSGLLDREAKDRPVPPGRAADLGCGTGIHTVDLARRGWQATGLDNQPRALRAARARGQAAGASASFRQADVTAFASSDLGGPASLFLDVGCFHRLPPAGQAAMARCVTAAAAPGATLLLLAFRPGRRGPLPSGVSRTGLEAAFTGWAVLAEEPAVTAGMPRALRRSAPQWYRLRLLPS